MREPVGVRGGVVGVVVATRPFGLEQHPAIGELIFLVIGVPPPAHSLRIAIRLSRQPRAYRHRLD